MSVAQVLALLGLPRHIVAARSMTTVNDPIKGRHDYLAELTQEMAEAIEHHYSADFDAFGFVRLSLGLRGEGVEARCSPFVGGEGVRASLRQRRRM